MASFAKHMKIEVSDLAWKRVGIPGFVPVTRLFPSQSIAFRDLFGARTELEGSVTQAAQGEPRAGQAGSLGRGQESPYDDVLAVRVTAQKAGRVPMPTLPECFP